MSKVNRPRILCAACHSNNVADLRWPSLCWGCAEKIRVIDRKAEYRNDILRDMISGGVGVRITRTKVVL